MGLQILCGILFLNTVPILATAAPLVDETSYPYVCRSKTIRSSTPSFRSIISSTSSSNYTTSTDQPSTSFPTTGLTSLSSSAVQTASSIVTSRFSGSIISVLETAGKSSALPYPTPILSVSTALSLVESVSISPKPTPIKPSGLSVADVFVPFANGPPPPQVSERADHPVRPFAIAPQTRKLQTNKFYANFFLSNQSYPTFTHPYSVAWAKGSGVLRSQGLTVTHVERSQTVFGPGSPASFFSNPLGLELIVLSANELKNSTRLTVDSLDAFSANVNLLPRSGAAPAVTFPLVQGMGFVTAVYHGSTPRIESTSFVSVIYIGLVTLSSTYKYVAELADGTSWNIYVTTSQIGYPVNSFTLISAQVLQGAPGFQGFIQVAKVPLDAGRDTKVIYDSAAGAYPVSATVSGSVEGVAGTYKMAWEKKGNATTPLLMFALPHHMEILSELGVTITDIKLQTTTKGIATAILGDSWSLTEPNLPIDMGFAPWSPSLGSVDKVSAEAARLINQAGEKELRQSIKNQSNLDSQYYSGKAFAKFASIIYAVHDIAENATLAATGLERLKAAFDTFVRNNQTFPMVYDSTWGGAVSVATYLTHDFQDFGNTYYNDHHFHYGYFVYAAAVIGYLDPKWLDQGTNKAWVNMLVRDYSNSVTDDGYFPFSRSFDWYHGHSWARGVLDSGDGKDEESSSEDTMSTYAIKMWGRTINDTALEARGNLMLAMQARSLQHYFLYTSDNKDQPAEFIGNKVSGILIENKIDYTTYFGNKTEYIHGIHMIPAGFPFSAYVRTKQFVTEEWDTFFSNGRANVGGGWRGILYGNLASIKPAESYAFFADAKFNSTFLDGGASLTWYLTYSAALGGG